MKKWFIVIAVAAVVFAGAGVIVVQRIPTQTGVEREKSPLTSKITDERESAVETENNGITEVSLKNPPEAVTKPSIDELKEFRRRSEQLKAIFEKLKNQGNGSEVTIGVGGAAVPVTPLYTFEDQKQGSIGRESLPQDEGTLYVFQMDDAGRLFGSTGMKFPIDLIWMNNDNTVVHIHKNVSPDYDGDLKSLWPARFVLEVNAGFADRQGIHAGDTLDLSKIPH